MNVGASPIQRPRENALSNPQADAPQTLTDENPIASRLALDVQYLGIDRRNHVLPVVSTTLPDLLINPGLEARRLKYHDPSTTKGKTPGNGLKKDDNKKPDIDKTPIYKYLESIHPGLPENTWPSFTKKWKFTNNKDDTAPREYALQKELGYDHIGSIFAKVTKGVSKKKKKKTTKTAPATVKYDVMDAKQLKMIIKKYSKEHEV